MTKHKQIQLKLSANLYSNRSLIGKINEPTSNAFRSGKCAQLFHIFLKLVDSVEEKAKK